MNNVVISIGSNSSDRQWQLDYAIRHLKSKFKSVSVSSIYESSAQNGKDAPYLNAVMVGETNMDLDKTTAFCKQWETLCGRTPASKLEGVIPIDIDIVVWNGDVVKETDFLFPYFTRGYHQLVAAGKVSQK